MNTKNPIQPPIQNPVGLDKQIEYLRTRMQSIPWIDRTFGTSFDLQVKTEKGMIVEPKVYVGNREYFSMMPNDSLKSFCFFSPLDALRPAGDNVAWQKNQFWFQRVAMVVFVNYPLIDRTQKFPFVEQLKDDVLSVLQSSQGVNVEEVYSNDIREIYKGWSLKHLSRDLLYFPFGGIRVEMELKIEMVAKPC